MAHIIETSPEPPEVAVFPDVQNLTEVDPSINYLTIAGNLAGLAVNPRRQLRVASAIGRGALGYGGRRDRRTESVVIHHNGIDQYYRVTQPEGVDPVTATNAVFFPGLAEMIDSGSGENLHQQYASSHPDERVISVATEGISRDGKIRNFKRHMDDMGTDTLATLPFILEDGEVRAFGTSRGSRAAFKLAEKNLAANPGDQINLQRLYLVSPATIACNIPSDERFYDPEIDDRQIRNELSRDFLRHIFPDLLGMTARYPADIIAAAPMVGAYALYPHKAARRAQAIVSDFKCVQEGIEWNTLNWISSEHEIFVLGGENCPLVKWQVPQWEAMAAKYPGNIAIKVVKGMGHLMTANASGAVAHLDSMQLPRLPLAAAA